MAKQFIQETCSPPPTIRPGCDIVYRALHVGYFNAKVLSVRPDGRVDLQFSPSPNSVLMLSRVVVKPSRAECGRGEAYIGGLPFQ